MRLAADRGRIAWDDLESERNYDGQRAYAASKIALGLFARELDERSRREGWGVRSVVSHPGVAPTSLLAARPEIGLAIDQTLTQDATGTMVMLELEALGLTRIQTELSVQYVDHNLLQTDEKNPEDHLFLQSAAQHARPTAQPDT